ncbi:MAG TPA: sodium:alanine symporter [Flavobacteriales bacterium]|jgi:AGCS family alanine or glycine:cation symporter|nr:sodium:alanine symporter [Flavobacteriales bacterium]
MDQIIQDINGLVWSNALIILALGSGLYFSIRTRFVQIRLIGEMVRLLFIGKSSEKGVSSFQAFALAISGRVGTGNIAGVATAIAMGGPGALFWMWVIAFLGSASAYVEATLGQIYKQEMDGQYRGGPAYYILNGLKIKWFAYLFAGVTIISTALLLPGVQSNSIVAGLNLAFEVPTLTSASFLVLMLGFIIVGGVKRISSVAEIVVPFMAVGYILMSLIIIGVHFREIPEIFSLILSSAFGKEAAFGGILGTTIAWGVKRGIYSNEAGQGTAPHAAAAAEVAHPAQQGLVQSFSVYVDTLLVCTSTGLMILFTGQYNVLDPSGGFIIENLPGVDFGPEFTQLAIDSVIPGFGKSFVAIALTFFAFTTIMAYYYIAETNVTFLAQEKRSSAAIWALRVVILFAVFYGTIKSVSVAWDMGDIGVGLMAWLNFIAIILLRKPALMALKDYELLRNR